MTKWKTFGKNRKYKYRYKILIRETSQAGNVVLERWIPYYFINLKSAQNFKNKYYDYESKPIRKVKLLSEFSHKGRPSKSLYGRFKQRFRDI